MQFKHTLGCLIDIIPKLGNLSIVMRSETVTITETAIRQMMVFILLCFDMYYVCSFFLIT